MTHSSCKLSLGKLAKKVNLKLLKYFALHCGVRVYLLWEEASWHAIGMRNRMAFHWQADSSPLLIAYWEVEETYSIFFGVSGRSNSFTYSLYGRPYEHRGRIIVKRG